MRRAGRERVLPVMILFLMAILTVAVLGGGCGKIVPAGEEKKDSPDARLLAYEQNGYIWVVQASGENGRKVSETGNMALGPWAPGGKKIAVLTAVDRSGELPTGYSGVLSLDGKLKAVVGPGGPIMVEPNEMDWIKDGESLVLGSLERIWVAREQGNTFRAQALYTAAPGGNERVWRPKSVPGGKEISFWITAGKGEGMSVDARLVTIPTSGGTPREIFRETIFAGGQMPANNLWSPDGSQVLVYAEPVEGSNCWWLINRKTGAKRAVLSPNAGDPQWLPEDGALVYAPQAALQIPGYEVFDTVTGGTRPFMAIPGWVTWLEVSPDGERLLLARAVGDDGIKWDLYVTTVNGTNTKRLAAGAGEARWQP